MRTFSYDEESGKLNSIEASDGEVVSYGYDGSLMTDVSYTGTLEGNVSFIYNDDFVVSSESVNGMYSAVIGRDDDLLVTQVDNLVVNRDPDTGFVTSTVLGDVETLVTYDDFGAVESLTTDGVLELSHARDDLGRITEIVDGSATTGYEYDAAGRLITVTAGGDTTTYTYDANGNRLTVARAMVLDATECDYDDQDRLISCGTLTYGFTDDGFLASKTNSKPEEETNYVYDAFSNLREVDLPDARVVEYVIDGQNRRIGKKIDGELVQGWLYGNQLQIAAETDGKGNITKRFLYASGSNVPDVAIIDSVEYRIVKDHLGSVRAIVAGDGTVVSARSYDAFGVSLTDDLPGFLPFGFAGGLEDLDTGLIRFGARDYDAETGRWTTKDPIQFAGGDTNLYVYAANNPINAIDPSGNWAGGLPPLPLAPPPTPVLGLAGPAAAVVAAAVGGAALGYACFESGLCDITDWFIDDDDQDFGTPDDICASGGGRPGDNRAQNRQYRQAIAACEAEIGRELQPWERDLLHESIHHLENPGYWEIIEECVSLFG